MTYFTNEYGLRQKDMDYMLNVFKSMPEIEQVIIYGSRAVGSFEKGSDIDLAISGEMITNLQIGRIHSMLENEGPTFLLFDVLHYNTLKNQALKKQIDEKGKLIYTVK